MVGRRGKKVSFNIKKRPSSPQSPIFSPSADNSGWLDPLFERHGMHPKPIIKKKARRLSVDSLSSSPSPLPENQTVSTREPGKRITKRVNPPSDVQPVQTNASKRHSEIGKLKEDVPLDISMKSVDITINKYPSAQVDACSNMSQDFGDNQCDILKVIEETVDTKDNGGQKPLLTEGNETPQQRVIKRLSVLQRMTYVSNFLFSLPISWALADPISEQPTLHDIEAKAYSGGYSSTKGFINDMTTLISTERSLITAETEHSIERLTSFKHIKSTLKGIQEYFHSYDNLPLEVFTTEPKKLIDAFTYSTTRCFYLKIADKSYMEETRLDGLLNIASFHAYHHPIFDLIENFGLGCRWSINEAPLVRLYVKANRSKLSACSQNNSSACLVEAKTSATSTFLVVKPIGSHHAVIDKGCTDMESPKAWIWAAVLGISPNLKNLNFGTLHSPRSFETTMLTLQKSIREFLDDFFK